MSKQRGKWLPQEDESFCKALDTFKLGEWEEITKVVGSKTVEQVKYRATYLLKNPKGNSESELYKKLFAAKNNTPPEQTQPSSNVTTTAVKPKRTYTKKQPSANKRGKMVPVEEEISIVSSSSSSSPALSDSSKSSINIMSSSSSESEVSESANSENSTNEPVKRLKDSENSMESNEPAPAHKSTNSTPSLANESVKSEISAVESAKSEKSSSWSIESSVGSVKSEASIASAESNTSKASKNSKVSKTSTTSIKSTASKTSVKSVASTVSKASVKSAASTVSKASAMSANSTRSKISTASTNSNTAETPKAVATLPVKIVSSKARTAAKKKIEPVSPAAPKSPAKSPAKVKVTKAAPVKRLGMAGRRTKAAATKPAHNEEVVEADRKGDKVELQSVTSEAVNETSEAIGDTLEAILADGSSEPITASNGTLPSVPTTPLPAANSIGTPTSKRPAKKPKKSIDPSEIEDTDAELIRKLAVGSARRRKIRSEEGDWIDPVELEGRTIDHQPPPPSEPKRKRKYTRKAEDLNDPFRLIWLNDYSAEMDAEEDERAPFRVEIDISVLCLLDFHSHLFASEIIGLLGGSFDATSRLVRISTVFPCKSSHSTGTEVDVDPLSEMEAGEHFERSGVRMIGWYHSHPNFEPNPSLRDLETQTMYQGLCRSVDGGQEAFVGIIVNPYLAVTESSSHVECFYVAQSTESGLERLPFRLPMHLTGVLNESLLLTEMRKLVEEATDASDALDMQKNAERGVSRVDKLLLSLGTHAKVDESHPFLVQVQQLFSKFNFNVLERTEEDYSF